MGWRSLGPKLLFMALLYTLQTCKGREAGSSGAPRPAFPADFPAAWDGQTDYAGSAFTIR